jgi:peptide deformylase
MADEPAQEGLLHPSRLGSKQSLILRRHPDPILREKCRPVEHFDSRLSDFLAEMLTLMRAHDGIGLAAPQVGLAQRLFVAEIGGQCIRLINPVIGMRRGLSRMAEGCLSLPGVSVEIERNSQIEVQGYDARGRRQTYGVQGLWARVVQREIDHHGVLICDKPHRPSGSTRPKSTESVDHKTSMGVRKMNQWTTHLVDYENLMEYLRRMAVRNGYVLNPDQERVEKVVGLMTENLVTAGRRFCPCKQTHPLDQNKDVVCRCATWEAEIEKEGHCFCRLFYRKA